MDVAGDTTLGQNLRVDGDGSFGGNVTVEKDLAVAGNGNFDGDLTVAGQTNVSDLKASGDVEVANDLTVGGTARFGQAIWNEGEEHQVEINSTGIRVGLNSTHMDAHGVYAGGHDWDEAKAAMNEDGRVKGIYGYLEKDLSVGGKADVGELDVKGDAVVGGNLSVAGDTNLNGNAAVAKDLTVGGDLDVAGYVRMQKDLAVKGSANIGGDLAVTGNQTVSGNSDIAGNQHIGKDLTVDGNANFGKDVNVGGNLNVAGDSTIAGTLTADRIIAGGKDMNKEINRLDDRIDKVGAQSAALAGLRPVDTDADQLWSFSAAYGNYAGESAGAIGLFYRPTDRVLVGVGGTVGDSKNMVNASLSFALNKGKNNGMSKQNLARQISALQNENQQMKQAMVAMAQKLGTMSLVQGRTAEFPDVPKDHWANRAVETLKGNGIMKGYPDGEFKGDKQMTRYEYAELLYNAMSRGVEIEQRVVNEYAPELAQVRAARLGQ